jgi:hypothetical protein
MEASMVVQKRNWGPWIFVAAIFAGLIALKLFMWE